MWLNIQTKKKIIELISCGGVYYVVQVVLNFESVGEILKSDRSNECYWALLSCGAVYYAVQGDSEFHKIFSRWKKSEGVTMQMKAVLVFCWVVFSRGGFFMHAVQGSVSRIRELKPKMWH